MTEQSTVAGTDRSRLFGLASTLLTYPDAALLAAGDELRAAVGEIEHDDVRTRLEAFLDWFLTTDVIEVETHYVHTFDLRRRSGLYLTYYLHGDTRKRGIALLTLKQRYRAHGLRLAQGELPDLLPVVLEFAAITGPGDGEAPLRQHRRGVELLRAALEENGSPYRHLLDAVVTALPPLTENDRDAIRALAEDGPPVESVGLAPYGTDVDSIGFGPTLGADAATDLSAEPCAHAHPSMERAR
ncbi:nitrate reductase molybdenum cofactor assembly chaperone [Lentzea sp. BCCO 10_0798]|uniref:Nitrate reductase molybdenum cofactor assembly chaperone n=1 Tax=Lentzea kristufekii TaxID=3095430 RepID=A0ABU4TNT3_9PSEU|nr:nitrate reductase molybdenum cofactor assembly chaperone [Lentzea sp. BCCO 10_0798]MDX8049941.1 nitrate reductase molybdenum cofactor assembly chaperone [Lentzea sp. BCCO 10_0798]